MQDFEQMGRIEAIRSLFEGSGFEPFAPAAVQPGGGQFISESRLLLEGIDFDLVYFPLRHLGYKSVALVTGALYAGLAGAGSLTVVLGISAKLGFSQIKELWEGVLVAAKEFGYKTLSLDLQPSRNGLAISVTAGGVVPSALSSRPAAASKDLLCVSGAPAAACFVDRGLADALLRLRRSTGLGVKVYADHIPFEGGSFELGKTLDLDPVSAAMNGGDDCRVLLVVPIGRYEAFRKDFQTFDIIGHLAQSDAGAVLVSPDGLEHPVSAPGWPKQENTL